MTMEICESGMKITYPNDNGFYIEKCNTYSKLCSFGVCSVECVINIKKNMVYFIELKTTAPDKENKNDLNSYVASIADKFAHSISMCYAMLHGIQQEDADYPIGIDLKHSLDNSPRIRFMLLVKSIAEENCPILAEMFRRQMKPLLKIWNADSVIVMSGAQAARKKLVVMK